MNRDHSVIFEIASKYCILDSFVEYDGYSISSKGFLPIVIEYNTCIDILSKWLITLLNLQQTESANLKIGHLKLLSLRNRKLKEIRTEPGLRNLRNIIKRINICTVDVPKGEERKVQRGYLKI